MCFPKLEKEDIIPHKKRDQQTVAGSLNKVLSHIEMPKTMYCDQGSKFKNATFQKILDKHHI